MKVKRLFCMAMTCVLVVCCVCVHAEAVEEAEREQDIFTARASGKFSMEVPADTIVKASSSFPLEAGETVRINASYSPDGSVDFGLIDSDGVFHYLNVTNGSIDRTILIEEKGNYTFAVRNNSSKTISVSGYVNY